MRKAILSLVVMFAVASVASAVPAGPSGSIYFETVDAAAGVVKLFYLDVLTDWTTKELAGPRVHQYTTYTETVATPGGTGYGINSAWVHPISGNVDMNGTWHDASLILAARYNNTPDVLSPAGDPVRGAGSDLIVVDADGTVNILNDGWNGPTGTNNGNTVRDTVGPREEFIGVDSNFTPTGEALGIVHQGRYGYGLWVDSDGDGKYRTFATGIPGTTWTSNSAQMGDLEYTALNGTVDGQAVTGVVVDFAGSPAAQPDFTVTYKTSTDNTYIQVISDFSNFPANFIPNTSSGRPFAIADVDGDGNLDVYYEGGGMLIHAEDADSDGNFTDLGEQRDSLVPGFNSSFLRDLDLVQAENGQWVLLHWQGRSNAGGLDQFKLTAISLDSDGQYDALGGTQVILIDTSDVSLQLGMTGGVESFGRIVFVPLGGGGGVIPEPATMLLVGTGVLGLVGIVRRRFLH